MLKRIRELLGKRKKPALKDSPANGASGGADSRGAADSAAATEPLARPPVHRGPSLVQRPIPQSDLDPDAVKIVRRLTRFDHKAYLVGGCVRDLLLDRRPKDFDVGTSATPRQIKRLFRNCRIIGRRFRLAHIYFQNGKIIEVATFRARDEDIDDEDVQDDVLIREDNVFGTPEQDALRRDFTINALFYDLNERTVIDHTDGLGDLRRALVRTIGDPGIRFREDPIRILRAIKFAARLDFRIEPRTVSALSRNRQEIRKSAPPRVLEEINRFGREGAARRSFELLRETEVLDVILPEVASECAGRRKSWELLLDLLDRMDRFRHGDERRIRTGETFAVMLLPMLTDRFGWKDDGTVDAARGADPRELVDELLRPIALRLRVPRREQEYCRQLLTTLARMVPAGRVRSNTRRAIKSRECLGDAQWILSVLARRFEGEFIKASEFWRGPAEPPPASGAETTTEERPRRRRRRRGSRGRGRAADGQAEERGPARSVSQPAAAPAQADAQEMPSPWEDDYFFAALPTAPEDGGKRRDDDDRRESATVLDDEAAADEPREDTADSTAAAPRRRRRRRRRRKRPGSEGASGEEPTETPDDKRDTDDTESEP